jgi:hypothetical protein
MADETPGRRDYIPRIYRVSGRGDLHEYLHRAVEASGGTVVYMSPPTRAPFVFGVQTTDGVRLALVVYAFRCNPPPIKGRPADEHRVQVRYGSEASWEEVHELAHDPTGSDITLVLGVHLEAELFIGLDPLLYATLPMGISIEFKEETLAAARETGWTVWERDNISGLRRPSPRSEGRLETLVACTPERLLDLAAFEQQATALGLDPPLRFRAAIAAGERDPSTESTLHRLEREFGLSAHEILDIVTDRRRLGVALRGGVAEHHLYRHLAHVPGVKEVRPIDEDGRHDFDVVVAGRDEPIRVECKNCSPNRYANGDFKVEVQKTRASQADPASRYYRTDQFDVVAACLYPSTRSWEFRFKATRLLEGHPVHGDRLAPMQRVDGTWASDFLEAQ